MWDQLKKLPPILVGQSIFCYLDLNSVVRLETALVSRERRQTMCRFLPYISTVDLEVHIPKEMTKLKWLQSHNFPIAKAILNLKNINAAFDTCWINEIELVDNWSVITSNTLSYLPDSCYEKIVLICFTQEQNVSLMEELFLRLHNLREVKVDCRPDGWLLNALRRLNIETNHNIMLVNIRINYYCNDHNYSVAEIVEYCPRLQSLSVEFYITEDSLIALSTHCPLLKKLDINFIPRVSTEESAALCAPALSCIHRIWTPNMNDDLDTSDYARTIPYLTELLVVGLYGNNDHVLQPLISQYCLKLESVDISEGSTITPEQLLQLAQNCEHLVTITISNYRLISDDMIVGMAERRSNLKSITLWGYDEIVLTDMGLLALSKHCPQLEKLVVYGGNTITEEVVVQLVQRCKQLRILSLPMSCMYEDTVFNVPVKVELKNDGTVLYSFESNHHYSTYNKVEDKEGM